MPRDHHPFELLEREHRIILSVVDAMERELAVERPWSDLEFWFEVSRFLAEYADGWHHGKEEDLLYSLLEATEEGHAVVVAMGHEHERGRALRRDLERAARAGDEERIAQAGASIAQLLRRHIIAEEEVVFPLARRLVAPERIAPAFAREQAGPNAELAHELEELALRLAGDVAPAAE